MFSFELMCTCRCFKLGRFVRNGDICKMNYVNRRVNYDEMQHNQVDMRHNLDAC